MRPLQAASKGQVEFRVERQGIIMAGVGKLSFTDSQLKDNLRAFMIALSNAKPETIKGQYFRVCVLILLGSEAMHGCTLYMCSMRL